MEETIGRITIAPNVLLTIVKFSALKEPGVARLSPRVPSRSRSRLRGKRAADRGVAVLVQDGKVTVEVHIIADGTVSAHELGESLQQRITDALEEMVGMPVEAVHVYIDDVDTNHRGKGS